MEDAHEVDARKDVFDGPGVTQVAQEGLVVTGALHFGPRRVAARAAPDLAPVLPVGALDGVRRPSMALGAHADPQVRLVRGEPGHDPVPRLRPLFLGWQRADPAAWSRAPLGANVGIVTGTPSGGLVVLDFDGIATGDVLGSEPSALAKRTLVVRTARGWHVYAREPGVPSCRWRGVDVKAEGGLVVAPPSIHPSGHRYSFLAGVRRVASVAEITGGLEVRSSEQHSPRPRGAAPAPLRPRSVESELVREWINRQAPRLRQAWSVLDGGPAPPGFDRSSAEFAAALSLAEAGFDREQAAGILLGLRGGKARERGEQYASETVRRAFAMRGS